MFNHNQVESLIILSGSQETTQCVLLMQNATFASHPAVLEQVEGNVLLKIFPKVTGEGNGDFNVLMIRLFNQIENKLSCKTHKSTSPSSSSSGNAIHSYA